MVLPSPLSLRRSLARRRLHHFVRHGWEVVEPETDLIWGHHIEDVCLHLEACTRQQLWKPGQPEPIGGRIQRLVINIPPGHMKSLLVSVFWPAWEWIENPGIRSLFSSYALDLAIRDSVRCRDLLLSSWYREWFDPQWALVGDQNVKSYFKTTSKGERMCLSVQSKATGFRGDKVVVDDPQNASEAHSDTIRENANTWWDRTMSSRLNDPRKGVRVIVQQRLHERDLTGHVLAKQAGYEHLCLPSEYDPEMAKGTSIGWRDRRTERGELLLPELFTADVLAQAKRDLGSADYAGQHGQRPSPAEGEIFKKRWWRFWVPRGVVLPPVRVQLDDGSWHECVQIELPETFDETILSWDLTFKDTKGTDFVAGQAWKRAVANAFLMAQRLGRMSFTTTLDEFQAQCREFPEARARYIEDKANGPAVISSLRDKIPGIVAVEPDGGKVGRGHAVTPSIESGNVYLPHPMYPGHEWVEHFIKEHTDFPNGANDDQVDALTQALMKLIVGPSWSLDWD